MNIFVLDGKGNVHNTETEEIIWDGDPAIVCFFCEEIAQLRAENRLLHRLLETGKEAACQALVLYQENQRLNDELRKLNAHA